MTKQVVYQIGGGAIIEWRDTAMFSYADPMQGTAVLAINDAAFASRDQWKSVVDNALSAQAVPLAAAPITMPVPDQVTGYQARVILAKYRLLAGTNAFFAALPEDDPRRLAWEFGASVQRTSEATLDAAKAVGLTDSNGDVDTDKVDAMFFEANAVT
jgi:hypothetical protein